MALYTILFGLSIFMIALVIAIIKKMFFHWKEEHQIERMSTPAVEHPTVNLIIYIDKCVIRKRYYNENIHIYDVISKSDIQLNEKNDIEVEFNRDEKDTQPNNLGLDTPGL